MSVLIKGMEMPQSCDECWALDESGDYPYCLITGETEGYRFNTKKYKMHRCPLIEVPTPHGRLIDADTFIKDWHLGYQCENCENDARRCEWPELTKMDICGMIEDAPTVIEADNI